MRIVGTAFLNWKWYSEKKRGAKQIVLSLQQKLNRGVVLRACKAWLEFVRKRNELQDGVHLIELRRTGRIFRMWHNTMARNRFERVRFFINNNLLCSKKHTPFIQ